MRRPLWLVLLLLWLPAVAADEPIGHVREARGEARIERAGEQVAVAVGTPVVLDDVILTGTDGEVGVTFADDTRIAVGPETEFVVDRFAYQPDAGDLSFGSRIGRGTLQFVSGGIAKLRPEAVEIRSPSGTLGVRGTRFLVHVEPAGSRP